MLFLYRLKEPSCSYVGDWRSRVFFSVQGILEDRGWEVESYFGE